MCSALSEMGCDVVTGGGPGLMQAGNEGARAQESKEPQSIGIRVDLPFEQQANPFVGQLYEHKTFFTRLHQFVLMSDAYIVAPGGIGTVLEAMMIWQLLQVRHLKDVPLVFAGPMWRGLVEWAKDQMSGRASSWPVRRISRFLVAWKMVPRLWLSSANINRAGLSPKARTVVDPAAAAGSRSTTVE
jgi:uncharacterized protein (TIGR00730 family)